MKTYQLSVELQVRSEKDADTIRTKWHALLGVIQDATVSAIKCAEVHKFEELHFSRVGAEPEVEAAIDFVARLVKLEADGGFGEFDAAAEVLVKSCWPNVSDWECSHVTLSHGVVTLHDLYVAA